MENTLYFGDNLKVLREHIPDESVDLIYLDPPFNSKASYNILFKEPTGEPSGAQITAFEDTWHWTEDTERTFNEIVQTTQPKVVEMMRAFRSFIGANDVMAYLTMMCIRLVELRRVLKETGSIYLHCDPTAGHYLKILMDTVFGKRNFQNEIVWCYRRWSAAAKRFQRQHDTIFFYSKGDGKHKYNSQYIGISEGTYRRWKGKKQQAIFEEGIRKAGSLEEETIGVPMPDWWNISIINPASRERLGYPTQKPEALLERIILASSNKGDVVLDPFCGCGTAVAVAHRLKRKWIGIDITHLAVSLIRWRLRNTFKGIRFRIIGEPVDLEGARELAHQNRFQFQWWALSLIDARPYGDKRKGADKGIDGYIYFMEEKGKIQKVVVSVKSGKVSVKDIRDLAGVMSRENSPIGLLLTLEPPTRDMKTEAAAKGFYHHSTWNKDYPRLQILTIEDLLEGNKPNLPHHSVVPFKKEAQAVEENENMEMF